MERQGKLQGRNSKELLQSSMPPWQTKSISTHFSISTLLASD